MSDVRRTDELKDLDESTKLNSTLPGLEYKIPGHITLIFCLLVNQSHHKVKIYDAKKFAHKMAVVFLKGFE